MDLLKTLKKQGGLTLVKRYIKSGAFLTAGVEFLLLGKSRTALEILRLSATLKTKIYLEKRYKKLLYEYDKIYDETCIHEQSNKVWICWFQGIENAPDIVQICYNSLRKNLRGKEIIVITADNISEYVTFPNYIKDKWNRGIITYTHMTDLLRLELLIKYGGTWIDSTVLCTRDISKIPEYYLNSNLFFYQTLKPGRDGHATVLSSWFMSATTNNRVLMAVRYLCYEYWKKNNDMVDYFLLHDFFQMVLEYYEDDWHEVVPVCNSTPHILLLRLFDRYDANLLNNIMNQTPFHKLSYKFSNEQKEIEETFYKHLLENI